MKLTAYIIVIALLLAGCMTTQKATDFLQKKGALASICADAYPVRDSLEIRERLHLDTITHTKTEYATDTIYVQGEPVIIKAKCPPSQTITKTVYRDSIHYVENTAKLKVWQGKADSLASVTIEKEKTIVLKESKINDLTDSRNQWRKWCLITWIIVAVYIVLKVWRPVQLPFKI